MATNLYQNFLGFTPYVDAILFTGESAGTSEDVSSQEVAFIVAPMGAIEQGSSEATEVTTSTAESSYVQVCIFDFGLYVILLRV